MPIVADPIVLPLDAMPQVSDSQLYSELLDVHNSIEILLYELNKLKARSVAVTDVQTAEYLIAVEDSVVLGDTSGLGASIIFYLPNPMLVPGYRYTIKHLDGVQDIDLQSLGGYLIDGVSSVPIAESEAVTVQSDGTSWIVLS